MKRTIILMCAMREGAKALVALAGLLMLLLPSAWIEGSIPLPLVILSMVGCAAIIHILWSATRYINRRISYLFDREAQLRQWKCEAPAREARRRQEWKRWFAEQEQEA